MATYRASKTAATFVDNGVAAVFLREHHKSKSANAEGIVSVGLYDNDELLAVAQFCKPRTALMARTYSVELLRMAFKNDVRIHGGASKLIKFYIETFKPADFFTYQDTTGEVTDVYSHAGMTLVKEGLDSTKDYLVAPGKSLATAKREDVLSMSYATRYGPDAILGTRLGEVLDPLTGKRKSNKRIFVEELGWHVETTTADRVYEWIDPDRTYYTYKITASDSDKYYYGVSHVKKANASLEDCLSDGYWGSGGVKYKNWKKLHAFKLHKEIVGIHSSRMKAFAAEERLVNLDDELCLNSTPGGIRNRAPSVIPRVVTNEECTVHSLTPHVNGFCSKCAVAERTTLRECQIHGLTKHQGRACYQCMLGKTVAIKHCLTHGNVAHLGGTCMTCAASASHSFKSCEIHGLSNHHGDQCSKCAVDTRTSTRVCAIHGETKFQGDACYRCSTASRHSQRECDVHGLTTFAGDSCYKCTTNKRYFTDICPTHGETIHTKAGCNRCQASKSFVERECEVHGLSKHNGPHCMKCQAKKGRVRNKAFGGISDEELQVKLKELLSRGLSRAQIAKELGVATSTVGLKLHEYKLI